MSSTIQQPLIMPSKIKYIHWTGLLIYLIANIVMYLINILTWPGFSSTNFSLWESTTSNKLYQACSSFWLTINISSTIITIYAIKKIFNTV